MKVNKEEKQRKIAINYISRKIEQYQQHIEFLKLFKKTSLANIVKPTIKGHKKKIIALENARRVLQG